MKQEFLITIDEELAKKLRHVKATQKVPISGQIELALGKYFKE